MRKGFIIIPLLFALISFSAYAVQAQLEFDEDSIDIDFEEYIEPSETPIPSPTPTKIPDHDYVLYGAEKKEFNENGFVVRTSFPFSKEDASLETLYSSVKVEFRDLKPNIATEKTLDFAVTNEGLFSYQTFVLQDDVLKSSGDLAIESTQCDIVRAPCSSTFARPWTSMEAGGLGYRLTGNDRPLDFIDAEQYRVFPVLSKNQTASPIFNESVLMGSRSGQIFFRILPPASFQEGSYASSLQILTLPRP